MILKKHSPRYRELLWQACLNDGGGKAKATATEGRK
jgi:hypothetical protein